MHDERFDTAQRTLRWYEWLLLPLLLFIAAGARADVVYKCIGANGTAYQSAPCATAQQQSTVAIDKVPTLTDAEKSAQQSSQKSLQRSVRGTESHGESRERRVEAARTSNAHTASGTGYECRSGDGQVFYRLSACPRSVAALKGGRNSRDAGKSRTVAVSAYRISHDEACSQLRRAGAVGRSGHGFDQDVSTYDKNAGRDPCR